MGYDIYIERDPPLTLAEWKAAVGGTEGVRLDVTAIVATNPVTKERISLPGADGDASVHVGDRWLLYFRWRREGSVVFRASEAFDNAEDTLRKISLILARKLNAQVIGDGDEHYD
jgi:hypothetical protein